MEKKELIYRSSVLTRKLNLFVLICLISLAIWVGTLLFLASKSELLILPVVWIVFFGVQLYAVIFQADKIVKEVKLEKSVLRIIYLNQNEDCFEYKQLKLKEIDSNSLTIQSYSDTNKTITLTNKIRHFGNLKRRLKVLVN